MFFNEVTKIQGGEGASGHREEGPVRGTPTPCLTPWPSRPCPTLCDWADVGRGDSRAPGNVLGEEWPLSIVHSRIHAAPPCLASTVAQRTTVFSKIHVHRQRRKTEERIREISQRMNTVRFRAAFGRCFRSLPPHRQPRCLLPLFNHWCQASSF